MKLPFVCWRFELWSLEDLGFFRLPVGRVACHFGRLGMAPVSSELWSKLLIDSLVALSKDHKDLMQLLC